MPVICVKSFDAARKRYKAETGKPSKTLMGKVADAYEPPAGTRPIKNDTLERYIRDARELPEARAFAICEAFKSCGYPLALEGEQIEDHIFDDTFLSFTPHLTPSGGSNRIEPDTPDQTATLDASYTVGWHTVTFGGAEGDHAVYTGRLVPQSLIIDAHFAKPVTRSEDVNDALTPITHETTATRHSWTLPELSKGVGRAKFGDLSGMFTQADRIVLYVDPHELKPTKIENILGDPVKTEDRNSDLLAQIQKEKERVLSGAVQRATGSSRRIIEKRLLPND